MARLERPTKTSSNPATKFLEWKSDHKCLSYYDKEKKENIKVQLPFKFIFLEHYHTVKGWNKKTESAIYSNEVFLISKEPLTVKSFKGGEIAQGVYTEIRNQVKNTGGVYHRSIYIMLEDGSLANLQIKGSAVSSYSDFFKENKQHIENDSWILIDSFTEGKHGAVKFTTPVFKLSDKTTPADENMIAAAANELQAYMNDYFNGKEVEVKSEVDKYEEETNDLAF